MKLITNEDIDNLYKEISQFNPDPAGVKYGADFPEFALAISGAACFKHWQERSITTGTMLPYLVDAIIETRRDELEKLREAKDIEGIKKLIKEAVLADNPYRQMFLKAIYLGYRLGKEYGTISQGDIKTDAVN